MPRRRSPSRRWPGSSRSIVDRTRLQPANALLAFSRSGLTVIGPGVAGLLVVTVGPGWALAFDAGTYLVAILCLWQVRLPEREQIRRWSNKNASPLPVRNHTQCDSLLLGTDCGAHTVPYIEVRNPSAQIEHEATTCKISDDQLFYAMQRGLDQEAAVALIVNGFAKEVLQQLPMEFAVEAQKLLGHFA